MEFGLPESCDTVSMNNRDGETKGDCGGRCVVDLLHEGFACSDAELELVDKLLGRELHELFERKRE